MARYAAGYPQKDAGDTQMVVDYIAGMTDSYAMSCYEKIYWI